MFLGLEEYIQSRTTETDNNTKEQKESKRRMSRALNYTDFVKVRKELVIA